MRSQAEYRSSFALEIVGSVFVGLIEFVEVFAIFGRTTSIGSFRYHDVLLLFGFAAISFAFADLCIGHIENLSTYVRAGTLDALLLRPLSIVAQLATSDFSLRRVGRAVLSCGVLAFALSSSSIDWTPAHIAIVIATPLIGTVIYGCVFIATASVAFWFTDAGEFANAFTYGGNYVAHFPFSIYGQALRQFFTFVIPVAFVSYVPTLAILGRLHAEGWPTWAGATPAVAAALALGGTRAAWTTGVRHYVGAGG